MNWLFLILLIWLPQAPMVDERVFEEAKLFIERSVEGFVNPESSISLPPKSYWEEALESLDVVYAMDPSRVVEGRYLFFSGMNLLAEGKVAEAISDFTRSIQIDPNEGALSRYGLGLAHSYLQDLDEAESQFRLASEVRPFWSRPYAALAALLMDSDRLAEAEAAILRSLELTEHEAAKGRQYLVLGQVLQSEGRDDEVEDALRQAVGATPEDLLLRDYLGLHLFGSGRRREALSAWVDALMISPGYAPIRRHVALAEEGVPIGETTAFELGESALRVTDAVLVGGTRYRVFSFAAEAGELWRVRVDSTDFTPLAYLVSAEGVLVGAPDIRSSYFSRIEQTLADKGTYYLIVSTDRPGPIGRFTMGFPD